MRKLMMMACVLLSVAACGDVEVQSEDLRTVEQKLCPPANFNHGKNPAAYYSGSQGTYEHYVYVGTNYDDCSGEFPLVMIFHGGGMTALKMATNPFMVDVMAWADSKGAILVYPDAETDPANPTDHKWNAGHTGSTAVDHVQMMIELGQHLQTEFNVDPDRRHAIGFSNGGAFAMHLAQSIPLTFGSIATMAGWSGTFVRTPAQLTCWNPYDPTCNFTLGYAWASLPPAPADYAVFMIRGTGDKIVPPDGIPVPAAQPFFTAGDILITPSVTNVANPGDTDFELWSDATGCTTTSVTTFAGVGESHVCQNGGKKVRHDIVFEMKHANGKNLGHYMPTLANTAGTYDGPTQITDFLWNNPR